MLIDTHLHLICDEYLDINKIINNANKAGVKYFVCAGTNNDDNKKNEELLKFFDNIYLAVGIHPEYCLDYDLVSLENIIINNKKRVVAIGEIGLDYHYKNNDRTVQIKLFEEQLKLAEKYNLPVVIHSRDATLDTINILNKYNVRGVIHCFSGSLEVAKEYIKMGFFLGIGGVVTFKNSNLKDTLKKISINNIILETDSPFLSPIRGQINEPKNVVFVAKFLSEIYDISYNDICNITTNNALNLFDIL